jgi:hypothetical protein
MLCECLHNIWLCTVLPMDDMLKPLKTVESFTVVEVAGMSKVQRATAALDLEQTYQQGVQASQDLQTGSLWLY